MKFEKLHPILTAAVLSCALAIGAVGCLVTGFDLDLESFRSVLLLCGVAAVVFSGLYALKWGSAGVICLLALLGGWLWHRGIFLQQLLSLLVRISKLYHQAYDWGYFLFAEEGLAADYPLAVLGGLIALAAAYSLVRGKGITLPLTLTALPLAACLVVTDTVPEIRYLFLLMAAFLLCMLTQSVRRDSPVQGSRLAAMAALPTVLALALLFWSVPKESYVNRSADIQEKIITLVEQLPQMAQRAAEEVTIGAPSDGQRNLDLKRMGARPRYTYAVMDITDSLGGTVYLRGQDYDAYTGTGWTASTHRAEPFGTEGPGEGAITISTRNKQDIFYLPYYAAGEIILAGGSLKNGDSQKEYRFEYSPLPENWPDFLTEPQDTRIELTDLEVTHFGSTADRLRYVTLPGETKVQAEEILQSILPENASRYEMAEAIADYVRNSAEYDLNTGRMPSEGSDFALWFLAESETGYCVHFATAAVVLLRAADIPARYVTGYIAQTQAGETTTVTAGEAHAWAEYYVPQLGRWVVLEATPAEAITAETAPVTEPVEIPESAPESSDAVELPQTQPTVPTQLPTVPQPSEEAPKGFGWLYGLLALLLTAAAVWIQRQLRLMLRQRRLEMGTANQRALARWSEAVLLARLMKQNPPEGLNTLAQKAKFSQHTLTDRELAQFDKYLTQSRAELRKRPWYWQLAYRLVFVVY